MAGVRNISGTSRRSQQFRGRLRGCRGWAVRSLMRVWCDDGEFR